MRGFLARWLVSTVAVALVALLLRPGIRVEGSDPALTLVLTGLVLGFLNAIVRPILILLTLPVTLLTFGLFLLIINALMLSWAAAIVPGFYVAHFGWALLGSFIISLIGFFFGNALRN